MITLLTPFRYLTIRHRSKLAYDALLPAAISVALTVLLLALKKPVPVFGDKAYLDQLQTLLTIVGGFFIAALTMLTADRNSMLGEPVGGMAPPRLPKEREPLSRRRYLAYLFGYLSTTSFALVAVGIVANLIAPQINISSDTGFVLKCAFVLVYNFWVAHVAVTTLLGLFYFTERLQISDAKMKVGQPSAPPSAGE